MEPNNYEQKSPNPTGKESDANRTGEEIITGANQTDQLKKLNPDTKQDDDTHSKS